MRTTTGTGPISWFRRCYTLTRSLRIFLVATNSSAHVWEAFKADLLERTAASLVESLIFETLHPSLSEVRIHWPVGTDQEFPVLTILDRMQGG